MKKYLYMQDFICKDVQHSIIYNSKTKQQPDSTCV